jgi:hypothetical protein
MLPGFSGSLVSEYFAETLLQEMFEGALGERTRDAARRQFWNWRRGPARQMGPVTSARGVHDLAAVPLIRALGFVPALLFTDAGGAFVLSSLGDPAGTPVLLAAPWSEPLDGVWRLAARSVLATGAAWCLSTNGRRVRLLEVRRAVAGGFVEFDLECAVEDDAAFAALWGMLRRESFEPPALIERVSVASSRHAVGVCKSLRVGVLDAIGALLSGFAGAAPRKTEAETDPADLDGLHEQALTVVYRVLFLLFAESRGLVPLWHPVYRRSYSIEALRDLAERPGRARGLWEALQAVSRLAHSGCRAGNLRVTPFNGRLFAPAATPLAESGRLDDEAARRVVLALSTTAGRAGTGRTRISYRDLGVEQLGAVYESVLDYRPRLVSPTERLEPELSRPTARRQPRPLVVSSRSSGVSSAPSSSEPTLLRGRPVASRAARMDVRLEPGSGVRKATGTFYTPRAITTYLVRRTLAPLAEDTSPEAILALRIVDPAMGSGAFLVAACRYLADAYESALIAAGGCHASDISDGDRRLFRRLVAQRCLYGVDRNPVAVQLARLSLWLCTLAPERPLTFLDHRLLVGDSLIGAAVDDVGRPPPGAARRRSSSRGETPLPLFDADDIGAAIRNVLPARQRVASMPDESLAVVREKERILARITGSSSPLSAWKAAADLWCGFAFRNGNRESSARVYPALADALLLGRSSLPAPVVEQWLAESRAEAATRRFFHWTLEFPEAFYSDEGAPVADAGFDAVIGNPPWDMVRDDNGGSDERASARANADALLRFARSSGVYRAQGDGHANLYQLFVERAFRLTRAGGRMGLVVPWGLASDAGCVGLRRLLLDHSEVDSWVGFENTSAIFPIHRSVRFLLMTASVGGRTDSLPCRLGERDPEVLDSHGESLEPCGRPPAVVLPRRLLERLSPDDLAVPDIRTSADIALLEKIAAAVPFLGSPAAWGAEFGRELNASDDRRHYDGASDGVPVLEGKHVEPFRVRAPANVNRLPANAAVRLLGEARTWDRPRLAYRDVASATNRLTLIAAIVPRGHVTVHTLFCLKTPLPLRDQEFLCGVLNSFVANYLVRLRVTTHVTTRIMSRLHVPRPSPQSSLFATVADLSAHLLRSPSPQQDLAYPALQAAVAHLYDLTADELRHILGTFPLIDGQTKTETMARYESCELAK